MTPVVLSHYHVVPLLRARQAGEVRAEISSDLGLTTLEVRIATQGVVFPGGEWVGWDDLEQIAANDLSCYVIENDHPVAIRFYSELSGLVYSLMPTASAPTMLVSGIPMHRIKDTNPRLDTLSKIHVVAPLRGRVLDTCTGLGYTAIEAAKTAAQVVTIEIDPAAQHVCRLNPWSQALFDNPRITQIIGDSFEEIQRFLDEEFSCIIHDPPTLNLAGELYSGEFYQQAYRVLKREGRMFHYIGDPNSKTGRRVGKGVVGRLKRVGFRRIVMRPEAFGMVVYKGW